jgi:hypothetical protein
MVRLVFSGLTVAAGGQLTCMGEPAARGVVAFRARQARRFARVSIWVAPRIFAHARIGFWCSAVWEFGAGMARPRIIAPAP